MVKKLVELIWNGQHLVAEGYDLRPKEVESRHFPLIITLDHSTYKGFYGFCPTKDANAYVRGMAIKITDDTDGTMQPIQFYWIDRETFLSAGGKY
jgi:hypothetical protein